MAQFLLSGLILVSAYYENLLMRMQEERVVYFLSVALIFIGIIGLLLTVVSFRQKVTPFPEPRRNSVLVQHGIYSVIRHPMYLFVSILAVGYCFFFNAFNSLFLCAFLVLFFDYKIRKEELYLRQQFPEYAEYQKRTKKLIPYIY